MMTFSNAQVWNILKQEQQYKKQNNKYISLNHLESEHSLVMKFSQFM